MLLQSARELRRSELLKELRRSLDVREQESDSSCRKRGLRHNRQGYGPPSSASWPRTLPMLVTTMSTPTRPLSWIRVGSDVADHRLVLEGRSPRRGLFPQGLTANRT